MGYIYINIFPKKLQFAAYGQFVLVFAINHVMIHVIEPPNSDTQILNFSNNKQQIRSV